MAFEISGLQQNQRLTDYLFKYTPDGYIAKALAPPIKVPSRLFYVTTLNNAPFRIPNGKTGPRGIVEQIQVEASQTTYFVEDIYLEGVVDKIEQGAAGFDLLAETGELVQDDLDLIHEKDLASVIFNAANYATGWKTQLVGGGQFNDAGANPISIIKTGIRKVQKWPTDLVFGINAWDAFIMNPSVLSVFGITGGAARDIGTAITPQAVANFFGVKRVSVGYTKYNAAAVGVTDDEQFVWGSHVAILHQSVDNRMSALAHTLVFSETLNWAGDFFEKDPGPQGSQFVRAGWNRQIVVKSNKMGYFIQDAAA